MSHPESPEFLQAQQATEAFTTKPTNDELLRLYGTRRPLGNLMACLNWVAEGSLEKYMGL